MEAAAACALKKSDITLPHPNEATQVMNYIPELSDDEDDDDSKENDIIFAVIIN